MRQPYRYSKSILFLSMLCLLWASAAAGDSDGKRTTSSSCVNRAEPEPGYGPNGGHALWLPGIGEDFVFDPADPASFEEHADGTAVLVGVARRRSMPSEAFRIEVLLSGLTSTPPAGSPKQELGSNAYGESGGPIDPATWHYYSGFSGRLIGVEDFIGAQIDLIQRGPVFQVGFGANGKNLSYGGSSWIDWVVVSQPLNRTVQSQGGGDLNLDFDLCERRCIAGALPSLESQPGTSGQLAVTLDGVGRDFAITGAELVIYPQGNTQVAPHAYLTGTLHSTADPRSGFELQWLLADYAVALRGVDGKAEVNGWHYFSRLEGQLDGYGLYAGAELDLELSGTPVQAGYGVSGQSESFRLEGHFSYQVTRQPDAMWLYTSGFGASHLAECQDGSCCRN